jgi:hypothetical protein
MEVARKIWTGREEENILVVRLEEIEMRVDLVYKVAGNEFMR